MTTIQFAGHNFILNADASLYWPSEKTLLVADLHLEKGSYFASLGNPLPIADTRATLHQLNAAIAHHKPDRVICLGDNVHDKNALNRMRAEDNHTLTTLVNSVSEWIWLAGNHDKLAQDWLSDYTLQNIHLTHDFNAALPFQIIGHYHPKISVKTRAATLQGKCFALSEHVMIMPSFGQYTGGLAVGHASIQQVLGLGDKYYYLLYRDAVWRVGLY